MQFVIFVKSRVAYFTVPTYAVVQSGTRGGSTLRRVQTHIPKSVGIYLFSYLFSYATTERATILE